MRWKIIIRLKEIDGESRNTLINFEKYKFIMFTMAKFMDLEKQSKIKLLYFFMSLSISDGSKITKGAACTAPL